MTEPPPWVPAFLPVDQACLYLGISRSNGLYRKLKQLDAGIFVQFGDGVTLIDIPRAVALIAAMPRGPRRPPGLRPRHRVDKPRRQP
jgi:hypothetical protein